MICILERDDDDDGCGVAEDDGDDDGGDDDGGDDDGDDVTNLGKDLS